MVRTVEKKTAETHLFYLQGVVLPRKLHGLHRNKVSHVVSDPSVCESTGGEYLVFNFNLFRYHHGIWQAPMYPSKSPQRYEESLLLDGLEIVLHDALTKRSEMAKKGDRYGSQLTRSNISIHSSASLHSNVNMK